ncbi:MAG: NAD(P)/FAD-dependent oxidoreductase [Gammaproteobacteria bacterium]|nr:NAD(P)/FAD-dependent oxidoreductase [Gammaproteobacteria bacterium]MDH4314360.1 NAD(P)/FAD-dependent oxidoreductase [Gammaproteobacteria bacterium]MDH5214198.1 NAD(P)/FAD-dependent oxidoreductase [Gammaproteobacteria bacterium]
MNRKNRRNHGHFSATDRQLGMDTEISRRDFLNGAAVAVGASWLPWMDAAAGAGSQDVPGYYPPELTGMRGAHAGSFETAHLVRDGQTFDGDDTGERYDLVVVGGGISGLAAAYYYREAHGPDARILILDNHDDFGGHAKRNEFRIGERHIIGYGGTMLIEAPAGYPAVAKQLLRDLGIETERFYRYFDRDLYSSLGLSEGLFLDKETFGSDFLAVGDLADPATLADSPLSEKARADLNRLYKDERNYLQDIPANQRSAVLEKISYQAYLRNHAAIGDEALKVMLAVARNVWAVNIDAYPAFDAWSGGYPGFGDLDLGVESYDREGDQEEPNIFHFPDGNATVARLLVRNMIPAAAPGRDMEDIVTARFDYSRLDDPESPVRLRLNSTVVRARHVNDRFSEPVDVTYVRDGKGHKVRGDKVVMACYNALIPRLCAEMPEAQKSALANCIRAPLVYSNVLVRNWQSFARLGINWVYCPAGYHHSIALDYPVSIGAYQCPKSPDEPIVLHLTRVPGEPGNPSAREQFAAGKRDLLTTSFEVFERNIRDQLNRLLGPGGFDSARDIAAITVNRWPHGYAYSYDPQSDQVAFEPSRWPKDKRHWEIGSRRFGNISIAGTDAASNAMTESAIVEAFRAVGDLD